LATGKNDFEAINAIDSEFYFMNAMGLNNIPGEATQRQRMDQQANVFLPIVERASIDFLVQIRPELTPVFTGHCPLDADVTPMDNSGTQKEGVSRTYKGHDGYAPMAVYLGQEGYLPATGIARRQTALPERYPCAFSQSTSGCKAHHGSTHLSPAGWRQ